MAVLMFQHKFAEAVASGAKTQTVRPIRKRPILPGDKLDLRKWNEVSYRSSQTKLLQAVCTSVTCVAITSDGIELGGERLDFYETEQFAIQDGFRTFIEMARWFQQQHKLPFVGTCIRWRPIEAPSPESTEDQK